MKHVALFFLGGYFLFSGVIGIYEGEVKGLSVIGSNAPNITFDNDVFYFIVSIAVRLGFGGWLLYSLKQKGN